MNLNEMKLGELSAIINLINDGNTEKQTHGAIGKKCIVRAYASGVHFGEVVSVENNGGRSRCELKNARRIWAWVSKKGISLSDVAVHGLVEKRGGDKSRVCEKVESIFLEDAIEFIPMSAEAVLSIEKMESDNG